MAASTPSSARSPLALGADVENLRLIGAADATAKATDAGVNGTGNAFANAITGSAGANLIDGRRE